MGKDANFAALVAGRSKGVLTDKMPDYQIKDLREVLGCVSDDKSIDLENRTVRAVVSDEIVDRDNEVVKASALKAAMKGFAENPVALACHKHVLEGGRAPVIGSWDTHSFKIVRGRSEMTITFAETELANEYWELYSKRFMRAFSISFWPIESHYKKIDGIQVRIITKIELFEISCVAVGANRNALAKYGIPASESFNNARKRKRDFVAGKKQATFESQVLAELEADPNNDKRCQEFAEVLLGESSNDDCNDGLDAAFTEKDFDTEAESKDYDFAALVRK